MTAENDRELLEAAAKAAGIELIGTVGLGKLLTAKGIGDRTWWNPLEDDGDALRLAGNLGLSIDIRLDGDVTAHLPGVAADVQWIGLDRDRTLPATRRAIVNAAAAIGRG